MIIHNVDKPQPFTYDWVYQKYDESWERMLDVMYYERDINENLYRN